jgi:hypothetical protein
MSAEEAYATNGFDQLLCLAQRFQDFVKRTVKDHPYPDLHVIQTFIYKNDMLYFCQPYYVSTIFTYECVVVKFLMIVSVCTATIFPFSTLNS